MATDIFNVGDLVWAKMKGFSPWPGKIVNPTKDVKRPAYKKPMQCVFFFGTDNYAWIPDESIKPYEAFKEQYSKQNKSLMFKEAVEAIEDYIRNRTEGPFKTSELPSIGEEIATIFPNGSNRSAPHKDYSRQPFQGKNQSSPLSPTGSEVNSVSPVKSKEQTDEPVAKTAKKEKVKKDTAKPAPVKRTSSESSTSSVSNKRAKASEKDKETVSLKETVSGDKPAKKVTAAAVTTAALTSSAMSGSGSSEAASPSSSSAPTTNHTTPRKATESIIMRPSFVSRPITPPLDVEEVSEILKKKNIKPSCLKFGFLGLGIMGKGIVKNFLNSGHSVTVWNRTPSKCRDFVKCGAVKGQTPADVVAACDITFSCVADPQAAKDMVFGNCGVLQEVRSGKGYIEMTSIDAETSQDIAEAVMARGGRYLEAQVQGSKQQAEEGTLIVLAAGDKTLFDDSQTCFQAMGKSSFYLGEVGNACKMNLVVNVMMGATLAGLAEAMALAERAGLQQKDVLEVLDLSSMASNLAIEKGRAIIEGAYSTCFPLQHMQKDLRLALELGDQLEQPLPLTATTNEMFKHAKRLGYGDHDASAIYIRSRDDCSVLANFCQKYDRDLARNEDDFVPLLVQSWSCL
ncbi:hypothetical protein CHUAL_010166 [Chamberlinius hualienensis]